MSASIEPYGVMSLLDFQKYFPDEAHCWEYVVRLRWPKGKSAAPECHQAMGFVRNPAGTFNAKKRDRCRKQICWRGGVQQGKRLFSSGSRPVHFSRQKWFYRAIYI